MYRETYQGLLDFIGQLPAFSDHDHHQTDAFFGEGMTLDKALANSYVAWTGYVPDGTRASREALLDNVRYNSYFVWFEKGLQQVHDVDEPISIENWKLISDKMAASYAADSDLHWRALLENGFERLILDTYWDPGQDDGHPDAFIPTFRIDKFMYGYHGDVVAPDEFVPWERYGVGAGSSLTDYVALMRQIIRDQYEAGKVAALKCAEAYHRPIDFMPDDQRAAEAIYGTPPKDVTREGHLLFGNYIFNRCCELAAELEIPFQVHTGLGELSGSSPMLLQPIIARYPQTRFVLFHSGYPWIHVVGGLAHNHPNALPSLTWTPTISTSAAVEALNDYIDVASSINTITWGSDCWVPEDSVGALLAWRHVVARVLAERMEYGLLDRRNAEILARKLMYENGHYVYGV